MGVDTIIEQAGVAKMTLYNNFGSKDELVAAYLRRRDEEWRALWEGLISRHTDPVARLLAVFEAYGEYPIAEEPRGCPFMNATTEIADHNHPGWEVARRHKDSIRVRLEELASEAGYGDREELAEQLLLLLEGATVISGLRRSTEPLDSARLYARRLLDESPRG